MKKRADIILVDLGFAATRSKAKLLIQSGVVTQNGNLIKKAGELISVENIHVDQPLKYVGRGGLKLEAAIERFELDFRDKVIADVGASTGGFTDCSLQNGAKLVYAIDVGHGQLAEKLVSDRRVVNMEKTNIRDLEKLEQKVDYCVADLSYISIRLTLERMFNLLIEGGKCVTLFKPQFEAGRENVGKGGIVKESIHKSLLTSFYEWSCEVGIVIEKATISPIRGKQGNREFLFLLSKCPRDASYNDQWNLFLEGL